MSKGLPDRRRGHPHGRCVLRRAVVDEGGRAELPPVTARPSSRQQPVGFRRAGRSPSLGGLGWTMYFVRIRGWMGGTDGMRGVFLFQHLCFSRSLLLQESTRLTAWDSAPH